MFPFSKTGEEAKKGWIRFLIFWQTVITETSPFPASFPLITISATASAEFLCDAMLVDPKASL